MLHASYSDGEQHETGAYAVPASTVALLSCPHCAAYCTRRFVRHILQQLDLTPSACMSNSSSFSAERRNQGLRTPVRKSTPTAELPKWYSHKHTSPVAQP
jgi:hypothetical protein